MPRPTSVTQTNAGSTKVIPLDYRAANYKCSLILTVVSGTPGATVELTADDVQAADFVPASANWQDHATLAALDASAKGNLAFPATGLRLTNSGVGVAKLDIIETGQSF